MHSPRDTALLHACEQLAVRPGDLLRIGGNYAPVLVHAGTAWVSGQVPRVGEQVAVAGCVGADTSLADAQRGARIAMLRALVHLGRAVGGLDRVAQALRVGVFVRSDPAFDRQSEVGDAASEVLHAVLGPDAGRHARTSVGVAQLPKGAAVEVELVVALAGPVGGTTEAGNAH
jgi:enamine deaminase RidA (YjgF/YER057c/UK114 family)